MGLFSTIGSVFGPVGSVIGAIGDYAMGKDEQGEANSANAAQAQLARQHQIEMRRTAYQDTVQDLQKAGLNPMLAYGNGATSAASAIMPAPMQNKGLAATQQMNNSAQAANTSATIENTKAQTDLIKAQTAKTVAEVPQITTSTANVAEQTKKIQQEVTNLKAGLDVIIEDKNLRYQQTLSEVQRRNLQIAQEELARIDARLRSSQISNVQAMTATQEVLTQLKQYEIPGAKNVADFERLMETGGGNASKALGGIANTANTIRHLLRSTDK